MTNDLRSPTVTVTNMPFNIDDDGFERWLIASGIDFEQMLIVRNPAGMTKCYAFVVARDAEQAQRIVQRIDGFKLQNRILSATLGQEPLRQRRVA